MPFPSKTSAAAAAAAGRGGKSRDGGGSGSAARAAGGGGGSGSGVSTTTANNNLAAGGRTFHSPLGRVATLGVRSSAKEISKRAGGGGVGGAASASASASDPPSRQKKKPPTTSTSDRIGKLQGFTTSARDVVRTAASSSVSSDGLGGARTIVIHVFDEARDARRDFTCELALLTREMRYFRSHLSGSATTTTGQSSSRPPTEMSVHCDVEVFAWLLEYVNATAGPGGIAEGPTLTVENVVPVLISSGALMFTLVPIRPRSRDFLRMERLTEEALAFIRARILDIVNQPLDVSCLAEHLLRRLAAQLTEDTLELVRRAPEPPPANVDVDVDVDDANAGEKKSSTSNSNSNGAALLVSKLYRLKLERLLEARAATTSVARCAACGRLYSSAHRNRLTCPRARTYVDFNGDVIARHVPMRSPGFEIHRHLQRLRARKHTWREIYWHLWGVLHVLPPCTRCRALVPASELAHCLYHPSRATFDALPGSGAGGALDSNEGRHQCCGAVALRFDAVSELRVTGCRAREHVLRPPDASGGGEGGETQTLEEWEAAQWVLGVLRRHYSLAVEPFSHSPGPTPVDAASTSSTGSTGPRPIGVDNGIFLARDHHSIGGVDVAEEVKALKAWRGEASAAAAAALREDESEDEDEDDEYEYDYDSSELDGEEEKEEGRAAAAAAAAAAGGGGGRAKAAATRRRTDDDVDDSSSDTSDDEPPRASSSASSAKRQTTAAAESGADAAAAGRAKTRKKKSAAAVAVGGARSKKTSSTLTTSSSSRVLRRSTANAAATCARSTPREIEAARVSSFAASYGLPEKSYASLPPHLRRFARGDALREEDARRTAEMIERLRACRGGGGSCSGGGTTSLAEEEEEGGENDDERGGGGGGGGGGRRPSSRAAASRRWT